MEPWNYEDVDVGVPKLPHGRLTPRPRTRIPDPPLPERAVSLEEWFDIPGFVGRYQVSTLGRVKSLPRPVPGWNGMKTRAKLIWGTADGRFRLHHGDTRKPVSLTLAEILLLTFVGPPPSDDHKATRRDGDPRNNDLANLYWALPSTRHNGELTQNGFESDDDSRLAAACERILRGGS